MKPVINLADVIVHADASRQPPGECAKLYDLRRGEVASRIGARKLGYRLMVVAPGKRSCPFHSHRMEEEMFHILQGDGELRHGDARYPLSAGDIVACPTGGPESAHQIINTGSSELRYLAVSTRAEVEICEYPDSRKFGAFADGGDHAGVAMEPLRILGRPHESLDYWDGE